MEWIAIVGSALSDADQDEVRSVFAPIVLHMPYFHGGGAEVVMVSLANAWHAQGIDVTMLVNDAVGPVRERLSPAVPVVSLGDLRTSRSFPKLIGYLREKRPPLIASSLISANIAAGFAVRAAGSSAAHVALIRNTISLEIGEERGAKSLVMGGLLKRALRGAERIGCVATSVAEDIIAYARLSPDKVEVTYNPIAPVAEVLPVPADLIPGRGGVIVSVGRIGEQKNYPVLLDGFARLRSERPCTLYILGDGPDRESLIARIAALGLNDDVVLLGYRKDAVRYIAAADVLALTSLYEGFPNVVAEALACGTTVMATDAPGGSRELLADGAFGYLAAPGDADGIAAALVAALDRPMEPAALRARAAEFSFERVAERYLGLFARAVQGRATSVKLAA